MRERYHCGDIFPALPNDLACLGVAGHDGPHNDGRTFWESEESLRRRTFVERAQREASRFTYDPRTATVMVDGVALSNPRLLLGADPHAPAIVEARAVMEFRLDPRVEMLVRRAILGAPFGDRGCFHDGCAPTEAREEGGTHWCTMAPVARCAR